MPKARQDKVQNFDFKQKRSGRDAIVPEIFLQKMRHSTQLIFRFKTFNFPTFVDL